MTKTVSPPENATPDLEAEFGFLYILRVDEQDEWIENWLEPKLLRPMLRKALRRRAQWVEFDDFVTGVTARLLRTIRQVPPPFPDVLPKRLPVWIAGALKDCFDRDRALLLAEGDPLLTPRLWMACSLFRCEPRKALEALQRLNEAPLPLRRKWQRRFDMLEADGVRAPQPVIETSRSA